MKKYLLTIIVMLIFLTGCSPTVQSKNPTWVDKLIKQFESDPVANPPLSIRSYDYNGKTVYFVPAHCCDIFSVVYDANGNVLCSPDGGISGEGDGKFPEFFSQKTNEQLIWQDTHTH